MINAENAERIKSELSQFKTTQAWSEIENYLQKKLEKYSDISIIDLDKVVLHELYYARGTVDTIRSILSFIRFNEKFQVKKEKEKKDGE